MKKLLLFAFIITFYLYPQTSDWNITGGIQLRTELDGRDFSNKTYPPSFTSLRTRLGVGKAISEKMQFYVQFQDSRLFGQPGNTLASISNTDMYQGYIKLNDLFESGVSLQAGRFEVAYGTERFFGAVGWHYVGRSFDGFRASFGKDVKTDVFILTHTKGFNYVANPTPATYPVNSAADNSFNIYGFWSSFDLTYGKFDAFSYYEINRMKSIAPDVDLSRLTAGLNHSGKYGDYSTITEVAIQTGKIGAKNNFAYLASLYGDYKIENSTLGLGFDILSGNDPTMTDKNNSFAVSYGTNHKFYGFMDYFINVPSNTFNLGLNDFYFRYGMKRGDWNFGADVHHFMSNQKAVTGENVFGQEVDLTIKYNFVKGTILTGGASIFIPGEIMKAAYSTITVDRKDMAFWTYFMITANL